ncbi:MAG: hypothetical protein K2X93_24570 [Candidatus Obscuribacterales bacterium]|nr:hypothetical protein [Candidatus Obscuribacterales bacterium]
MQQQFHRSERKELLVTGFAFTLSAVILFVLDKPVVPYIAFTLGAVSLIGFIFFQSVGRSIHKLLTAIRLSIQQAVSYMVLTIVYFCFVSILGSILSLLGMDKLRKDFGKYQLTKTMFEDAPATDLDNFKRQS